MVIRLGKGRPTAFNVPKSPPMPVIALDPSPPVSNGSPILDDRPRKTSTFRRVPRNTRAPLPSSPLAGGHARTTSTSSMTPSSQRPTTGNRRHSTPLNADAIAASLSSVVPQCGPHPLPRPLPFPACHHRFLPANHTHSNTSVCSPSPSAQTPPRPSAAPYRPGFQPKGVYRPRTDEFIAHRKAHAVSAGYASAERTKLERRLEKLIALHFPEEAKSTTGVGRRPGVAPTMNANRRASSFFDLDLKTAEQRITPWQEDSSVSKCPLCTLVLFLFEDDKLHPLTNRKHHCRLCGQIICALPVKRPQRPQLCSVLFVVDPKTRNIEEVGEGVDYELQEAAEEEKFLRGVRICNQCRPVLLRQQYHQQGMHVPSFVKLYEAFVVLEKEIEDSLPQFQELILTLNHDSQPTKEASAARKRLLEAFAQYDSLAKRIRNLPTPNGRGSSQERVQIAVMTRANLFLQKNMFPLQSLPTPKKQGTAAASTFIDPTSATALALQPLLEQEALLETFVEEAKAQRKFEDAKTLRVNLGEIREEIERVLAAEGLKGKRARKGR
ncbi:hypothetical protein B0H13DRAFT_2231863 [Mycena leptocephala]|nr:hypothetical protein B0H13DRAFT_2231863 [Mycena leptocephala]